jgi:hypothetical protein
MTLLEAIGALLLSLTAIFGLLRVGQESMGRHVHNTSFYREIDTWKKWNSPGYEKFPNP